MMISRFHQLNDWAQKELDLANIVLIPMKGDASFRRYYRVIKQNQSFVLMDSKPDLENVYSYIAIGEEFKSKNIKVPAIYGADLERGFLLIEDFGDKTLLNELTALNVSNLYNKCMDTLLKISNCTEMSRWKLSYFNDEEISKELHGFNDWFLKGYAKRNVHKQILNEVFTLLIKAANQQPQVCIHRDYHSRNLMVLKDLSLGVLDYQDASIGPLTYDLVSLLRDCYVVWPNEKVLNWVSDFYLKVKENMNFKNFSLNQFIYWFDMMGLQRHMKAIFIFARKFLRDHSSVYLNDIPIALKYIIDISSEYKELTKFNQFISQVVLYNL